MLLFTYPFAMAALGLAAAATLPAPGDHALTKRGIGTCDGTDFAPLKVVGSSSGTPFCESNWGSSYVPITEITVWSNSVRVTGIQVTYSDGEQSGILGGTANTEKSIAVSYATNVGWSRVSILWLATTPRFPSTRGRALVA